MTYSANLSFFATKTNASGAINSGIDGVPIGANTASTGAFTSGTFSTTLGVTGVATLGNGAILGTPASANLANCTFPTLNQNTTGTAAGLSATLAVASGGTGATTLTANGIVYGNGTSIIGVTSAGTTGQILVATTSGAPSWGAVPTTAAVTSITFGTTGLTPSSATTGVVTVAGTLIAGNGGTGQSSYAVGDILYASTTSALSKLVGVATGNVIISGGVTTAPSYGKVGLTTHVSGTLPVANGGTNLTSYAVGDILYASATGTLSSLVDVATGNVIISGGVTTAPSYGKVGLTTHVSGTLPVANGGTGVTTSTGTGAVVLGTNPTIAIAGSALTLQDATDATKTANFVLSGLTTGTNFTYTLPAVTGVALATLGNISQTFLGATTFAPTTASSTLILGSTTGTGTLTLGRSTVSQTTNIQAGATAASSTKTINIGTGGLVSSTTAITIGSAQAGTSTTTLNGVTLIPSGATINTPSGSTLDFQVNSVTAVSMGASGTSFGSTILTAAGTTSVAPFSFSATGNALLTTPAEGTMEYLDGESYFVTPNSTNGRAFIVANNYRRLIADGTAIVGTIANFFGGTSNISLVSGDYYEIEIYMLAARGSSAGTATITLTNSAAPTLMFVDYEQSPITGVVTPPGGANNLRGTTTTTSAAYSFTTGSLTASVNHFFRFKIWLRNGSGTSLKIQMTAGATNNSMTPQAGSYYLVRTLPNGQTGTFSA